ncbi:MAG: hypothetical protein IPL91_14875 [Hyphomicrobium sp.]|nr:hypothetical protein [Hyphomicrobium sp.]
MKLDPFAVQVSKTGDQSCQPGGECRFDIKLFNDGRIDHNAPVTITDKLNGIGAMPIVSIVPPLPCATQPIEVPFCTSPGDHPLQIGAAEHFVMTIRVPSNATGSFSNCADVAAKAPPQSKSSGTDINATSAKCHTVAVGPATPQCSGGMTAGADGRCTCPPGTAWNGRICASGSAEQIAYNLRQLRPCKTARAVWCSTNPALLVPGDDTMEWTCASKRRRAVLAGATSEDFEVEKQPPPKPRRRKTAPLPEPEPQGNDKRSGGSDRS